MLVRETFFSVTVADMERATAFYVGAMSATVKAATPQWSSLFIAGVRLGLYADPQHKPAHTGLHFAVDDLAAACADVDRAGGKIKKAPYEVAPGITLAEVSDSEGNTLTLRGP
jgi:predicted enzyme related to lactoylglutathione lyase